MARGDTLTDANHALGRRLANQLRDQRVASGERVIEVAFATLANIRNRCAPMGSDSGHPIVVKMIDDVMALAQAYVETEKGAREGWITKQDGSRYEPCDGLPEGDGLAETDADREAAAVERAEHIEDLASSPITQCSTCGGDGLAEECSGAGKTKDVPCSDCGGTGVDKDMMPDSGPAPLRLRRPSGSGPWPGDPGHRHTYPLPEGQWVNAWPPHWGVANIRTSVADILALPGRTENNEVDEAIVTLRRDVNMTTGRLVTSTAEVVLKVLNEVQRLRDHRDPDWEVEPNKVYSRQDDSPATPDVLEVSFVGVRAVILRIKESMYSEEGAVVFRDRGSSPHTRAALLQLALAIERDNKERPQCDSAG